MLKRLFDILFSIIGLILVSPILLVLAILIKREDEGPVFYRGVRVGRNGKLFRIYKFRTMVVNAEKMGGSSTADDDPRITRVGKFIRKYKLDELPQLINVLKGEMSFVGPRPQVQWAVELYNDEEKQLLTVRPGITDYASIKFRNEAEILKGSTNPDKEYLEKIAPEKLRLGLEYVENCSLWTIRFDKIKDKIIELRGENVILDNDVAELYGVETRDVNKAVKNNPDKFHGGYIFELTKKELEDLRWKFSTTKFAMTRVLPKAFTERGLYMLATILKSERATETTIAIIVVILCNSGDTILNY